MKQHRERDLVLINAAGFLRSFGVGLLGVLLGIYLFRLGLSSLEIGFVIAAGLAGSALATVVTSLGADRLGRKRFLVSLSLLSAVGGIAFRKPSSSERTPVSGTHVLPAADLVSGTHAPSTSLS